MNAYMYIANCIYTYYMHGVHHWSSMPKGHRICVVTCARLQVWKPLPLWSSFGMQFHHTWSCFDCLEMFCIVICICTSCKKKPGHYIRWMAGCFQRSTLQNSCASFMMALMLGSMNVDPIKSESNMECLRIVRSLQSLNSGGFSFWSVPRKNCMAASRMLGP